MENFTKVLEGIHMEALLEEVEKNEEMFGQFPLRTNYPGSAHKEIVDVLLRGPEIRMGSTLEDLQNAVVCSNYQNMDKFPLLYSHYLMNLMRTVEGTILGRVVLTKLPPGGRIEKHVDEGDAAEMYERYHIVVSAEKGSTFFAGEEQQEMLTGEIWRFDNNALHWVENNSSSDRIHVVCDIYRG